MPCAEHRLPHLTQYFRDALTDRLHGAGLPESAGAAEFLATPWCPQPGDLVSVHIQSLLTGAGDSSADPELDSRLAFWSNAHHQATLDLGADAELAVHIIRAVRERFNDLIRMRPSASCKSVLDAALIDGNAVLNGSPPRHLVYALHGLRVHAPCELEGTHIEFHVPEDADWDQRYPGNVPNTLLRHRLLGEVDVEHARRQLDRTLDFLRLVTLTPVRVGYEDQTGDGEWCPIRSSSGSWLETSVKDLSDFDTRQVRALLRCDLDDGPAYDGPFERLHEALFAKSEPIAAAWCVSGIESLIGVDVKEPETPRVAVMRRLRALLPPLNFPGADLLEAAYDARNGVFHRDPIDQVARDLEIVRMKRGDGTRQFFEIILRTFRAVVLRAITLEVQEHLPIAEVLRRIDQKQPLPE